MDWEGLDFDSGDESFQGSNNLSSSSAVYSPFIWMLSVRPVRRLTHFSPLSLLFQPDTRLFCHHGPSCQMNQEHQKMYSHDLPIFDSVATPQNPQGVPGVQQTWSLESNSIFQNEDQLPDPLRNNQVLVYVHGHRTRYLKATATLSHLSLKAPGRTVIGFLWPSHSRKESYVFARSKASTEAAHRLRILLVALQRLGNSIHVVSHSMGVRLTLHTLSYPQPTANSNEVQGSEGTQLIQPIESFFMLGAAIPSNAFHPSNTDPNNSWNYESLLTNQIINLYSTRDHVLSSAYQWAEAFAQYSVMTLFNKDTKAMGSVGISKDSSANIEEKVHDLDVSDEVPTHSVHAYLESLTFQEYLQRLLQVGN